MGTNSKPSALVADGFLLSNAAMLNLILAICCGTFFYVIIRVSKKHVKHPTSMLACNYIACVAVGLATVLLQGSAPNQTGLPFAILFGCVCGFFYVASIILIDRSMVTNGIVLTALFARLGLLVPLFASVLFFDESLSLWQSAGIVLALSAIVIMHSAEDLKGFRLNLSLILLLVVNGTTSALLKVYEVYGTSALSSTFLCINFLVAGLLAWLLAWRRNEGLDRITLLYGLVLGIVNFHTSKFLLAALASIPASIAYPVQAVSIIILIAFTGILMFRERLRKTQWAGVATCCVAIALLNI